MTGFGSASISGDVKTKSFLVAVLAFVSIVSPLFAADPPPAPPPVTEKASTSRLYFDAFASLTTPDFHESDYGYGLGVGYQVSKTWGADLRVAHDGLDVDGKGISEVGGRLIARMPFEFLSPYVFLGGTFQLEQDQWRIRPGAGIELGVSKKLRGLSLFGEGAIDADLKGRNGYLFNAGLRLRF